MQGLMPQARLVDPHAHELATIGIAHAVCSLGCHAKPGQQACPEQQSAGQLTISR